MENVKETYQAETRVLFDAQPFTLGAWASYNMVHDPKHLAFELARYKFAARMLQSKEVIMEVGPGDGFGLPILAEGKDRFYAVDWDQRHIDSIEERLGFLDNLHPIVNDFNKETLDIWVDGVAMIDVLEHLDPENEADFMYNVVELMYGDGIMVVGTPNKTAEQWASPQSEALHINLQTYESLEELMSKYFHNVLMFGMNDEVLHTGYPKMCHYLWAVGVGPRT